MKPRYLVLAGTYVQFVNWCRRNDVSPMDAVYVADSQRIRGLDPKKFVLVETGTCYQHEDYPRIREAIRVLEMHGGFSTMERP